MLLFFRVRRDTGSNRSIELENLGPAYYAGNVAFGPASA
jgi:hypothetical protein